MCRWITGDPNSGASLGTGLKAIENSDGTITVSNGLSASGMSREEAFDLLRRNGFTPCLKCGRWFFRKDPEDRCSPCDWAYLRTLMKQDVQNLCNEEGSYEISHATMRMRDLFPAVQPFLKGTLLFNEVEAIRMAAEKDPVVWEKEENIILFHEEVFTYMNTLAPDGFYFGSHVGDGSAIGFWPCAE